MHKKAIIIGILIGIIGNVLGIGLYILLFSKLSVEETLKAAIRQGFVGGLIALGAVVNLVAFFIFIKKNRLYEARGVLIATLVSAIIIVVSKFG